ncbi:OmpA family protein [Flavobacterium frigidarium]|uniref:OmpA family protein n=1 Tax=Flavobacterium frigidarium TaxID=99286 RepID=UPI00047B53CB|nr:OmpA family protein [Flavobacterium frigidarium]
MKKNILLYIMFLSIISISAYSQKAKLNTAETQYNNFAYINSIETFERIAGKGYKSAEIFQKLGNAYYFNGEFQSAAKWYTELFALGSDYDKEYYYRYAQSLKTIGENKKADEYLEKFSAIAKDDNRAKFFRNEEDYLKRIKANSGRYDISKTTINSKYSDYGSTVYNNKLVFTSARDTGSLGQRIHTWTDQYFTSLYSSDLDENFNPSKVERFDNHLKSKFNESTPVFTKDSSTVYFTRNNYLDGKRGQNGSGITLIKIYKAVLKNNEWTDIKELPFNSNEYSTAHPTLSPDEKTLYFASDMPGTLGQSDLFKVAIIGKDSYGKPVNLGPLVNTPGRETFPFISQDNEIYFASDGHPGMGGLDIFMSKINADGSFKRIENIGSDINSPFDDFAYWIDLDTRYGFFSSNKVNGLGFDDIYKFKELRRIGCEQALSGLITDAATLELLPNAKVSLYNNEHNLIESTTADDKALYTFNVECDNNYYVRAEKENYFTKEVSVSIPDENGSTDLPIALETSVKKVKVGDDLAKFLEIPIIYFDLDKSNIRPDAALELSKVLDVLQQSPKMKIDIRSHTDSRASSKYNESLSERRAKSTMKWLIDNGISADRLTSKGYGESRLINKCADGVECTEAEHQLNRRSEFIIMSLN